MSTLVPIRGDMVAGATDTNTRKRQSKEKEKEVVEPLTHSSAQVLPRLVVTRAVPQPAQNNFSDTLCIMATPYCRHKIKNRRH